MKEELVASVDNLKKEITTLEKKLNLEDCKNDYLLLLQNLEVADERYAAASARLHERTEDLR